MNTEKYLSYMTKKAVGFELSKYRTSREIQQAISIFKTSIRLLLSKKDKSKNKSKIQYTLKSFNTALKKAKEREAKRFEKIVDLDMELETIKTIDESEDTQ